MASRDVDPQEFLQAFSKTYSDWAASGQAVELTADFGAPGGDAEKKHKNYLAVHEVNTAKLKTLFDDAEELDGVDGVALAKAATVSPIELRKARDQLG